MRLEWHRPGVVRLTGKIEEVAALVAGARIAAGALREVPGESDSELRRVLADFDRAARALHSTGSGSAARARTAASP